MNLFSLPLDVLETIFFHIPSKEIYRISLLCRRGRVIINNEYWIKRAAKILNKELIPEFRELFDLIDSKSEIKYYRMISYGYKVEEKSVKYLPPKLCLYYAILDDNYSKISYFVSLLDAISDAVSRNITKTVIELCMFLRRWRCLLVFLESVSKIKWKEVEKNSPHLKIPYQCVITFPFLKSIPKEPRRRILELLFENDLILDSSESPKYFLKHYINGRQTAAYTYFEEGNSCINHHKHGDVYKIFNEFMIDCIENIEELDSLQLSEYIKFGLAANWIARKGEYIVKHKECFKDPIPVPRGMINYCLSPLSFENLLYFLKWDGDYDPIYLNGTIGIERDKINNDADYSNMYYGLKNGLFKPFFSKELKLHLCQECFHYCTDLTHRCHNIEQY